MAPDSPTSSTPWARWRRRVPPASSTTPNPQNLEPGSMPKTLTTVPSRKCGAEPRAPDRKRCDERRGRMQRGIQPRRRGSSAPRNGGRIPADFRDGTLCPRLYRGHLLVGNLEVRMDVLDVVVLLEVLDQSEHLLRRLPGDLHRALREEDEPGRAHGQLGLERLVDLDQGAGVGPDLEPALAVRHHVLRPRVQRELHHLVLVGALLHRDHALALE